MSLWSAPGAAPDDAAAIMHWAGHRSLRVRLQRTCTDASPFHPVAGIAYVAAEDRLIVTLLDGSFHVVQDLATRPEWAAKAIIDAAAGHVNSEALSRTSRATFEAAEKGAVDRSDMVHIDGAVMYDGGATFLWMYEWVFVSWSYAAGASVDGFCAQVESAVRFQLQARRKAQQHVGGRAALGAGR